VSVHQSKKSKKEPTGRRLFEKYQGQTQGQKLVAIYRNISDVRRLYSKNLLENWEDGECMNASALQP
jgi:hypothetical protein